MPSIQAEEIIGKQVEILHDLVTVIGEYAAKRESAVTDHSIGKTAVCADP